MARVLPQCLPGAYGEESGRGSARAEQAALTRTTGCFPKAAALLPNRGPLPGAAGGAPPFSRIWYARARLQAEGRWLSQEGSVAQAMPLDWSPKFQEASALMEFAEAEMTRGCQGRGRPFIF